MISMINKDNFSIFKNGNFWDVSLDTEELIISKNEDDGNINPKKFILAGILSNYSIIGDFCITVDFYLKNFPFPEGSLQLNEAVMGLVSASGNIFYILRFHLGNRDLVEVFHSPPGAVIREMRSYIYQGRYRILRKDGVATGFITSINSKKFISLGSLENFHDPVKIKLFAAQGRNFGARSTTEINIRFKNLIVESIDKNVHFIEFN